MAEHSGRVVTITGGTSGIGLAIAKHHLAAGDSVVIGSLDVTESTLGSLHLDPDRARFLRVDVGRADDVEALVSYTLAEFGRLDVMVNNAGIGDGGLLVRDFDHERMRRVNAVLFEGVALGMKHAARVMVPQGSGSIVNISSIAGIATHINSDHIYSAAKAAVVHLTKTASLELAAANVRVNCICPGYIATPLFGRDLGLTGEALDASVEVAFEVFSDMQPLRRVGRPEDIAAACFWLSSGEASFVTGHALVVDGGASVGNWEPERWRGHAIDLAMQKINKSKQEDSSGIEATTRC
ncbi:MULTISPECIES: glucose 1-dehydrogenase [unclassified Mesorhizobium]|uniref:SDR family NAD(P)-dependent oxidoreductase n=1 Tax=unclassified Mesorhizobium TaxID=325217 RepID=UPI000FD72562|nr:MULTISPECIES: glucose 1-dehydrogenase [unclassified Mesorhizobium]TGT71901.1 glucose 1-dehydrogenase [Mesorhizobium sp. M2E.F.Ca.ET.166.01.1.1]TGV99384.1 glucose 1-dehydrogenase [Mesorhizobium sp. M2E.F.Ca.ET.154.01.1.1]